MLVLQVEPKAESVPQEGLVRVAGQSTGMPFHFCFTLQQRLHRHGHVGTKMTASLECSADSDLHNFQLHQCAQGTSAVSEIIAMDHECDFSHS
jgi:hypothetical protein